jgi:CheY-like chemotaxis protein
LERKAGSVNFLAMAASTIPYALVVDDDAMILMHACDILEGAGFRFYEAGSGDEALELLEQLAGNVTLLFSDVEMPGRIDGFALARYAAEHWPWIEIVIASGRVAPVKDDMPAGATFISKPFTNDMVLAHLRKALPDGKQPEPLRHAI